MDMSFFFPEILIFDREAHREETAARGQLQFRFASVHIHDRPEEAASRARILNPKRDFALIIVPTLHSKSSEGILCFNTDTAAHSELVLQIGLTGMGVAVVSEEFLLEHFDYYFALFDARSHCPLRTGPPEELLREYAEGRRFCHNEVYFSRHWRHIFRTVRESSGLS